MARDESLDLEAARERFEGSTDFTQAVEEEFAILDPETLDLAHGFERMFRDAQSDPILADSVRGELIDTEIEIRSGRSESFAELCDRQRERRRLLFDLADRHGRALASWGTHPWANYLDQAIIDTPHYRRLRAELGWVAQRNNTWSLHVHVGVRGADRAIAVCDHLRKVLPTLLAISANSTFLDATDTSLHSVRSQIFTRTFPRCGIHEPFGDWSTYAEFVDLLERTELDRRVDAALVERPAPSQLRDRRGADLRRAERRRGVVRARRADDRLRRPGGPRLRRRDPDRPAAPAGRSRRTSGGRSGTVSTVG